MTEAQPTPSPDGPVPAEGDPAPRRAQPARPGYWFPLLLFGLLIAISVPISARALPETAGFTLLTRVTNWSAAQEFYLGSGPDTLGVFRFPMSWYWTAALVAGFAVTAAWYLWRGRRAGRRTPVRAFLLTGLALTALAAALPLLTVVTPALTGWLGAQWAAGTYALVIIAVGLWVLARAEHSRALAVIALAYSVPAILNVLASAQFAAVGGFPPPGAPNAAYASTLFITLPLESPLILVPVAVLVVGGLAALAVSAIGPRLRSRPGAQP